MCVCCQDFVLTVIGNNAIADAAASPVVLTVDRPLTDMPANHCFDLCVPKAMLKNVNVNELQLSDGTTTLDMVSRCTDPLRYDSLFKHCADCPAQCNGYVKLRCNRRTEPAPGHIFVKTCLPPSSYVAPATPAGGGAASTPAAASARAAARKTTTDA